MRPASGTVSGTGPGPPWPRPGLEGELSARARQQAEEGLLPQGGAHAGGHRLARRDRDLPPLAVPIEAQSPGLPVHRQDLEQVDERHLRQVPLEMPNVGGAPGGIGAAQEVIDPREEDLRLVGLLEPPGCRRSGAPGRRPASSTGIPSVLGLERRMRRNVRGSSSGVCES